MSLYENFVKNNFKLDLSKISNELNYSIETKTSNKFEFKPTFTEEYINSKIISKPQNIKTSNKFKLKPFTEEDFEIDESYFKDDIKINKSYFRDDIKIKELEKNIQMGNGLKTILALYEYGKLIKGKIKQKKVSGKNDKEIKELAENLYEVFLYTVLPFLESDFVKDSLILMKFYGEEMQIVITDLLITHFKPSIDDIKRFIFKLIKTKILGDKKLPKFYFIAMIDYIKNSVIIEKKWEVVDGAKLANLICLYLYLNGDKDIINQSEKLYLNEFKIFYKPNDEQYHKIFLPNYDYLFVYKSIEYLYNEVKLFNFKSNNKIDKRLMKFWEVYRKYSERFIGGNMIIDDFWQLLYYANNKFYGLRFEDHKSLQHPKLTSEIIDDPFFRRMVIKSSKLNHVLENVSYVCTYYGYEEILPHILYKFKSKEVFKHVRTSMVYRLSSLLEFRKENINKYTMMYILLETFLNFDDFLKPLIDENLKFKDDFNFLMLLRAIIYLNDYKLARKLFKIYFIWIEKNKNNQIIIDNFIKSGRGTGIKFMILWRVVARDYSYFENKKYMDLEKYAIGGYKRFFSEIFSRAFLPERGEYDYKMNKILFLLVLKDLYNTFYIQYFINSKFLFENYEKLYKEEFIKNYDEWKKIKGIQIVEHFIFFRTTFLKFKKFIVELGIPFMNIFQYSPTFIRNSQYKFLKIDNNKNLMNYYIYYDLIMEKYKKIMYEKNEIVEKLKRYLTKDDIIDAIYMIKELKEKYDKLSFK